MGKQWTGGGIFRPRVRAQRGCSVQGMKTFTAILEDRYIEQTAHPDREHTIAWKAGFPTRGAAWRWVIDQTAQRWPGSAVVAEMEEWSRRDLASATPASTAIDFTAIQPGDPAHGAGLAVTISDAEELSDASYYDVPESE